MCRGQDRPALRSSRHRRAMHLRTRYEYLIGGRTSSIMCGRVRLASDHSEIKIDLGLAEILRDHYEKRWNVPPTSMIPAIVSQDGVRRLEPMRWGLIPAWAKD